jgi:ubiquinone/menaquinone biosynthesis C-methylase UbiE
VTKALSSEAAAQLAAALQAIYDRPQPAAPWRDGENLPWDDPQFSERMLQQHLDQSHGAASRRMPEIRAQVQVMKEWLGLGPGSHLLDVTCGPGLYAAEFGRQGIQVTGIDFGPASVRYARELCARLPVEIVQGDVRQMDFAGRELDAAIYLYGQFTVLRPEESLDVLRRIHAALRPGAMLLLEVLDDTRIDKKNSTWWYTDQGGLWGDFPYLHLGERAWDQERRAVIERFYVLNLESGQMSSYGLSDQAYTSDMMRDMLEEAGFTGVTVHPAWDGLALKDAQEWCVYIAQRGTHVP